jgi:hypothetical protein
MLGEAGMPLSPAAVRSLSTRQRFWRGVCAEDLVTQELDSIRKRACWRVDMAGRQATQALPPGVISA